MNINFTAHSHERISGCVDILNDILEHFTQQNEFGTECPNGTNCCNIVVREDGKVCKCAVGALMSEEALECENKNSNAEDLSCKTIREIHNSYLWGNHESMLGWDHYPASKVIEFKKFLSEVQAAHDGLSNPWSMERGQIHRKLRFEQFLFVLREASFILTSVANGMPSIAAAKAGTMSPQGILLGSHADYIDRIVNSAMKFAVKI